jgi:hypothetical protein
MCKSQYEIGRLVAVIFLHADDMRATALKYPGFFVFLCYFDWKIIVVRMACATCYLYDVCFLKIK